MPDVICQFTIPSIHVSICKEAVEYYAKHRGELAQEATFTAAQAKAYIESQSKARLVELVKVYKSDTKRAVAEAEATTETNQVVLT
jgi:hypothetical protein